MYLSDRTTAKETRGSEVVFLVHFIAFENFDLEKYLQNLRVKHIFRVVKGAGTHAQSIEIAITPSTLRELQTELPFSVVVSYETVERPENC